jgi:hypothetical protein
MKFADIGKNKLAQETLSNNYTQVCIKIGQTAFRDFGILARKKRVVYLCSVLFDKSKTKTSYNK